MKTPLLFFLFSALLLLTPGCDPFSKGGNSHGPGSSSPSPSTQSNLTITPSQESTGIQPSSQINLLLTARSGNGVLQAISKEGGVYRYDPRLKNWIQRGALPEEFSYENRSELVFFGIPPGRSAEPGLIVASQRKVFGCWSGSASFWAVALPAHASPIVYWTTGCFSTPGRPELLCQTSDGRIGMVTLPDPSSPIPLLRWAVPFTYRVVSSHDYDGNGRDEILDEGMVPWMNSAAYGQWPVFRPDTRGPWPSRAAYSGVSEDFNRDGRADVVAWFPDSTGSNWGQLRLYLSGHPQLDLPFRLPGTVSLQQLSPRPAYYLTADLDGDAFSDLVLITNLGESFFYLYRANTLSPSGYWLLPAQTWSNRPLLTDYNLDGKPELVLMNASGLETYKLAPLANQHYF